MAKTYITTVKYQVDLNFDIDGVVDKEDIIGAIFGQSEGLLGEEMDLKELQQSGKLGRIEVKFKSEFGKTHGQLIVPSSMNMPETTLLAAAVESVEKVGPCDAKFEIVSLSDVRQEKRAKIKERARQLLDKLKQSSAPNANELAEEIKESSRELGVKIFGPDKLSCGPEIATQKEIIVVEGRADVLTMLRSNIKNVISMGGSNISKSIIDLSKKAELTLFIDGDRGGELNARKLMQVAKVDYLARAPAGKEVEELTQKEILLSLKRKVSADEKPRTTRTRESTYTRTSDRPPATRGSSSSPVVSDQRTSFRPRPVMGASPRSSFRSDTRSNARPDFRTGTRTSRPDTRVLRAPVERKSIDAQPPTAEETKKFKPLLDELRGKMKAKLLNAKMEEILLTDVRNTLEALQKSKSVHAIVFDGIVTKRLAEAAQNAKVKYIVGIRKADITADKELRALVM